MVRPSFAFRYRARIRFRSCPLRFERLEQRSLLSAVSWTGTAGDNNWDTPTNWSGNALPGAADDVTIDVNADVVHSDNVTDSIHSLNSTQPLTITGGTLSIATASTISSTLTLNGAAPAFTGGTLNGAGDITVGGLLSLNLGTLGGTGTVTANGGIALNKTGSFGFVLDGKTLVNSAGQTATISGGFVPFTLRDGATIVNDGAFVQQANLGSFNNQNNAGAAVAFINNGSFTQSGGDSSTFTFSGVAFNENSPGTVDVVSGELDLSDGASIGGGFTAESGATLGFSGNYTLDANSSTTGAGTVGFGITAGSATSFPVNVNVTVLGTYNVTGTTFLGSAAVNFDGPVVDVGNTLKSAPDMAALATAAANFNTVFLGSAGSIPAITLNGGTVNFGSNPITATTLTLGTIAPVFAGTQTSIVIGTGDITVSGLTALNFAELIGSGTVTANGGLTGDDTELILDGKTLINPAGQTATFTGFGVDFTERNGANIINNGTFQAQFSGAFGNTDNAGAPVSFTNNGTFIQSSSQVLSFDGVAFNTTAPGTVAVPNGFLVLAGGGTETGAPFTIASGATLQFSGSTDFHLDADTTFSGAGTITYIPSNNPTAMLVIPGNSPSFTGPIGLDGGTMLVNGSMPGSAVAVASTGILGGTGSVGAITSVGTVKPGTATATGILSANGDVRLANHQLTSISFFQVALAGADPGTGFDQLAVAGTADITDTTLNASLVNFTPGPGQKFPIITSTAPIVGTFVDLPEGAPLTISGVPFTISYVGGTNHNDIVLTQTGTQTATNTTLSSSANPSVLGQPLTFTATVAPGSGTGSPTGTVTFTIDGNAQAPVTVQVVDGHDEASLPPIANLAVGTHTIAAAYSGDGSFAGSTATPLNQMVNPAPLAATSTMLVSSFNPSVVSDPVTFSAIVTSQASGTPTGTVTFTIDGTPRDPVPLVDSGGTDRAEFPDTTLAVGSHTITATYNGDGNFATSTAAPLTQSVLPLVTTTTALTSSINPSIVNSPVTFTATVQPTSGTAAPSGTVNFLDGTTPIGSGALGSNHQATLTTSALAAGAHMITAVYAGDADLAGSGSSLLLQTVNPAVSATSFVATPNPASAGQPVTLTATVTGSLPPTGSVTFKEGTTVLGTAALNGSGAASLVLSSLSAGTHLLTAVYRGSSDLTPSTSNTVSLVVNPVAPPDAISPHVDSFQRFGFHAQPTVLVLTFSRTLAPAPAQNVNNYQIVLKSGHARSADLVTSKLHVTRAVYDPATSKLMLFTSARLNVHNTYQLTVNGTSPGGLTGTTDVPLAGAGNVAGTNYVAAIRFSTMVGPFAQALQPALRQLQSPAQVLAKLPLAALDWLAASGELSVQSILAARQHARKTSHHGS